jgi:DNA polymerase III subunit epsilon
VTLRAALPGPHRRRPLDLPWPDAEYCVVDLETTGLDLRRDDIVSYGAVLIRGGRVLVGTASYGLVRPDRPVSPASIAVHGLRSSDLADAMSPDQAADHLLTLTTGRLLVAHAAWIETAFLSRAFRRRGRRLTSPVVDTLALARAAGHPVTATQRDPSLESLARRLNLPVHTPHHALGDALTTAQVLIVLASRLGTGPPVTARALVRLSRHQG